ncbi:MAG: hypothetical protein HY461_02805 [Parcubacteria group bacterium]|nr:hypothetical protein [Parcubacteria group bacterium]
MSSSGSILDKVLENKQAEELEQFDPAVILQLLFVELSEREQQVLTRRFGLTGVEPQTLELIGQEFGVTRERVRQIETGGIKKLRKVDASQGHLKQVESVLNQVLQQHGGVMEQEHLLDNVLDRHSESAHQRAILLFLIERLLSEKLDRFHHVEHYHASWKLVTTPEAEIEKILSRLIAVVEEHGEPVEEDLLVAKALEALDQEVHERIVRSHLRISRKLKQNIFGHWGKADWNSITPKRMNDKIFLVLKQTRQPLHFTDIAAKINELKFDHKTAYPATVHNELILDEKYVLVGRGIYALSEWGYEPGVVADVIARVLAKRTEPMTRDEIVAEVLRQRLVGKSTVHLALMNKDRFAKTDDGRFKLISDQPSA